MASKDTNTGAKRARETRAQLGLGGAVPIGCVLTTVERDLDLPVVIAVLPEGVAGCCWRGDGDRVVLWVNGAHAAVRQRFTLAHELGHVRCAHDMGTAVETFETLGGKSTDSREVQANAFAAELLAPADAIRASIDTEPSLEDVVLLAARQRDPWKDGPRRRPRATPGVRAPDALLGAPRHLVVPRARAEAS